MIDVFPYVMLAYAVAGVWFCTLWEMRLSTPSLWARVMIWLVMGVIAFWAHEIAVTSSPVAR